MISCRLCWCFVFCPVLMDPFMTLYWEGVRLYLCREKGRKWSLHNSRTNDKRSCRATIREVARRAWWLEVGALRGISTSVSIDRSLERRISPSDVTTVKKRGHVARNYQELKKAKGWESDVNVHELARSRLITFGVCHSPGDK